MARSGTKTVREREGLRIHGQRKSNDKEASSVQNGQHMESLKHCMKPLGCRLKIGLESRREAGKVKRENSMTKTILGAKWAEALTSCQTELTGANRISFNGAIKLIRHAAQNGYPRRKTGFGHFARIAGLPLYVVT